MSLFIWRRFPLLVAAGLISLARPASSQTYTCLGSQNPEAVQLRDHVYSLVVSTSDTLRVRLRGLYQLPAGSNISVTIETRKQTCEIAGQKLNALLLPGQPPISRTLAVIKVGSTRWVVEDPNERAGEWNTWFVFDSKWQKLSKIFG